MLRTFIQFTSIAVTFIATFFWIRGAALLSRRDLATLAGTYFGYNPATLNSLASQKEDSLIAGALLGLSFILQTWNALWPMRWCDFGIDKWGALISVGVSIFLFIFCFWGSSFLRKYYVSESKAFLSQQELLEGGFNNPR